MTLGAQMGGWLLQAMATLPDTIVTKQVVAEPGWFTKLTSIASGLVSIGVLILVIFLVPAAWRFRKTFDKVNALVERIYGDINPITRHASNVADNIDYITTSIRTDIQQVSHTVQTANERLNAALTASERRLKELNALLQVIQEEAEDTFVSTAATLRAVRAGAMAFRDEAALPAPEHDDLDEAEESDDGYDSAHAHGRRARPRIRPRAGRRDPT